MKEIREISIDILEFLLSNKYPNRSSLLTNMPSLIVERYALFPTALDGLIALGYVTEKPEICLTEKGGKAIKEYKTILSRISWLIPDKHVPDWSGAFENLMVVGKEQFKNSPKVCKTIDSNRDQLFSLVEDLNDEQKYNFYVSLQDQMEQEALKDMGNK